MPMQEQYIDHLRIADKLISTVDNSIFAVGMTDVPLVQSAM
jgi:hypothetical protein